MADDEDEEVIEYAYEGPRNAGEEVELKVSVEDEEGNTKEKTKMFKLLGAREGVGKAAYTNGDTYEGEYVNGKRDGKGVYIYKAKNWRYEGQFKAGLRHGLGVMQYSKTERYQGFWVEGKKSGQGTMWYANKDIYTGEWLDGEKHGAGVYYFHETGGELDGTWEAGNYVHGSWVDKAGLKYIGRFENQLPSSDGEFLFPSGVQVKGYYKQGKPGKDGTPSLQWVQTDVVGPPAVSTATAK